MENKIGLLENLERMLDILDIRSQKNTEKRLKRLSELNLSSYQDENDKVLKKYITRINSVKATALSLKKILERVKEKEGTKIMNIIESINIDNIENIDLSDLKQKLELKTGSISVDKKIIEKVLSLAKEYLILKYMKDKISSDVNEAIEASNYSELYKKAKRQLERAKGEVDKYASLVYILKTIDITEEAKGKLENAISTYKKEIGKIKGIYEEQVTKLISKVQELQKEIKNEIANVGNNIKRYKKEIEKGESKKERYIKDIERIIKDIEKYSRDEQYTTRLKSEYAIYAAKLALVLKGRKPQITL